MGSYFGFFELLCFFFFTCKLLSVASEETLVLH